MTGACITVFPDPLEIARQCGGFYECPKDDTGRRLGPLVGYAGTYTDANGGDKHYVGEVYFNFAMVEQHPQPLDSFAAMLIAKLPEEIHIDVALGAPEGGKALALAFARIWGCRYAAAEKKVTVAATATSREKAKLIMSRHDVKMEEDVLLIEDVCNNFTTTSELIGLVKETGANVVGVGCALNRSPHTTVPGEGGDYIVDSVVYRKLPQYRQDDPYVAADVSAGNVVWKVKPEWQKLAAAMEEFRKR